MNKYKVTYLIVLMAVALLGIIVMQLLWMRNALEVREELFDRSVNEAMVRAAERLETFNDVMVVDHMIRPLPPRSVGLMPRAVDQIDFKGDSIIFINRKNNTQSMRKHVQLIHSDSFGTRIEQENYVVNVDSVIKGVQQNIEHTISIIMNDGDEADTTETILVSYDQRKKQLGNVAGKMFSEVIEWKNKKDIDTIALTQILRKELDAREIPIAFEYAIENKDTSLFKSKNANLKELEKSSYRTQLNPRDIFNKGQMLSVYFPQKRRFVLKALVLPASLSLLFCTIILVAFIISIYYILRQKKISEMKSDFINNMTHEFKTPLATISVASDTIMNDKVISDPLQVRHFTAVIKKENARMNGQVETILQIARLDRKDFEFNFKVADIHDIVDRAVQGMILQVENRKGYIIVEKEAMNPVVTTDPVHCQNMLNNLLDNANKYSPQIPEILVKTRNTEKGVWIAVSDKGIGMSKQVQTKIFEKFYREATGNIHNVKGFGLGLSYVKAVLTANKGEIRVASQPEKGSTFEVFIPFSIAAGM